MSGVLDGIRVVELGMYVFVPSAGAVLADWGADVIKVEPPAGDPVRGIRYGDTGTDFPWTLCNRGKRSIVLDLGLSSGREAMMELVDTADVFLVSLLPQARRKLGVEPSDIMGRNRAVIYASGSGQGADGPEAGRASFDTLSFWARGGVASAVTPGAAPSLLPMPAGAFGDTVSALALAAAVSAALVRRQRTGEGTFVDASLLGTAMWAMQFGIVGAALRGLDELPRPADHVPNPLNHLYATADGRHVALGMLHADRYWPGFCEAIGRPDLVSHPLFANMGVREQNSPACVKEIQDAFARRPLREWEEILSRQEGQWQTVRRSGELYQDQQVISNGFVRRIENDDRVTAVAAPAQFDHAAPDLRRAPGFSEHTDEVLGELGWDEERIMNARVEGGVF